MYRHHWAYQPSHPDYARLWPQIIHDTRLIIERVRQAGIVIAGPDGYRRPTLEAAAGIEFNGDATTDLDGEAFRLLAPLPVHPRGRPAATAVCGTGRKPYDLAVSAVLLRCTLLLPSAFAIASDGAWDREWADGATLGAATPRLGARPLVADLFDTAPGGSPLRGSVAGIRFTREDTPPPGPLRTPGAMTRAPAAGIDLPSLGWPTHAQRAAAAADDTNHPGQLATSEMTGLTVGRTSLSTFFDTFAEHHPDATRRVIAAANLAACMIPAVTVAAILAGHTGLALAGVIAGILLYPAGYHAAAWRYGRRQRAAVAAAGRDALTGLPSRAVADQLILQATDTAGDVTIALADVDWLKPINDNLGFAAGDQYLLAIARRLADATPPDGVLVRHGGDEFAILAPGADPGILAASIGAAMTRPVAIAGARLRPRASVGIAASGGGDAAYTRGCADAALASAKAAGGARALIYSLDRDGRPNRDGTRPVVRRRDIPPRGDGDLAWLPEPGDELVPLLWTLQQARTVHNALCIVRDHWEQAQHDAQAAADQPPQPTEPTPGRLNIAPTPGGWRGIASMAAQEQAKYRQLAEHLGRLLDAFPDPSTAARVPDGPASVVLVGISAAFTAIEVEGLVRTAAEVICDCQVCLLVRRLSGSR